MLQIPYVRTKVASIASTELSNYLGVPVRIGKVDIGWFNRIVLDNVYLADQERKPLFVANHVAAGFEALPLLKGKMVFTTVQLFGFTLNLKKKTPDGKLNLQFVIGAFASKDTVKKKSNIDLRFNTILIRRGRFRYDVQSAEYLPEKFDGQHIDVRNLSANISLKAFNKDSLNANIKKMSFEESSGFKLNKLTLNLIGNKDSAFVDNFEIKLPQTNLKIDHASINLTKVKQLKDWMNSALITLSIPSSQVCLKDLSPFVPAFHNFTDIIELSAEASGYVNNINLKRLLLKYSDKMLFVGKMEMRGITHPKNAYILGQVNKMYVTTDGIAGLVSNFNGHPAKLPDPIIKLGTVNFSGEISGFFDNLVAYGKLSSAIGSLQADLVLGKDKDERVGSFIKGHISTSVIQLHELFAANNPYGEVKLDVVLDTHQPKGGSFSGNIKADIDEFKYNGYKYEKILLSGNFNPNSFNGKININDPNGKLHAEGLFKHEGRNSVFNFTSKVEHLRPDSLHLMKKYEAPDISFAMNANFRGNNIDNLEGQIQVDSLSFKTKPSSFFLRKLLVNATGTEKDRRLTIQSDVLNGEVTGAYSFTTLIPSLINTMKAYLPALANTKTTKKNFMENNFSLLFTVGNTEAISKTLKLPISIVNEGRITGLYNNRYNRFRVEAFLPKFNMGSSMFESGYLTCDNSEGNANMQLKVINYNDKGNRNYLDLKMDARDNVVNSLLSWANNKTRQFKADLSASTRFSEWKNESGQSKLHTEISLNKSPLILNDTLWNIAPSKITVDGGRIAIKNFSVSHNNEYLHMKGFISKNPSDTLLLDMKQVELSYIFDILNIPVLQFAGKATGKFNISDLYGSRMLNTDLEVQNFSFNQVILGRLNLFSEWDDAQKGIMMLGSIYANDTTWTDVSGYVYPVGPNDGLSLFFSAKDMNIAFLQPFVGSIAKNIKGRGYGDVHFYGPFSALNIEGDAYVKDGGFGIDYTNTYYHFSDSIHMTTKSITARNITVHDKFNNSAKVNMTVNHNHFRDLTYNVNIQAKNMLVYDIPKKTNPMIYGSAFGTGTTTIQGSGKLINFDINLRSDPKTAITLNFMDESASEYDFINFVNKKEIQQQAAEAKNDSVRKTLITHKTDDATEYKMNFLFDVTPDATIDVIMDPIAGDKISGNCTGSLQMQYGSKTDLRLYGNLDITSGKYNFSLQQLIHKDFKIREGSSISFRGDPYDATMNINAIYNLTANIQDLDASFVTETPKRNIPVNCVLLLDGMLRSPNISFDIELPGSNEELERQVKSLVDTEDMMTRQIVYLLVLNKFYTPDYTINPYASNDFSAVASSALSTQISNIMNSFTDKVQLGTNIRTSQDGLQDTEVEMLLSSQLLDNRLLFNGNFGYKNSSAAQKNAFIGEFDLEYKLNRSGDIRLKAYNHANELYSMYLRQSLTTQGVGIMYKKDFTRLSEIFHKQRMLFTRVRPAAKDTVPKQNKREKIK